MKLKKVAYLLMLTCTVVFAAAGCGNSGNKEKEAGTAVKEAGTSQGSAAASSVDYSTGKHHVKIDVKDYGTITLELDADNAPITVNNFAKLANKKFFDGLTFHRIISGFMIQGGDPLGDGTGGSDEEIKGEFSNNGVKNPISHVRGVISMARSPYDNNSASSQFFIVHQDSTFLDGDYAAFGQVTEGMDVVDKICEKVPAQDDNGTVLKGDQPIISSITMID